MSNFKAMTHGMFGVVSVNRKLRALHDRIDELEARIGLGAGTSAPEQAATVTSDSGFDWTTSEDTKALKAYALQELGLTIKGNKSARTIRTEIFEFLED